MTAACDARTGVCDVCACSGNTCVCSVAALTRSSSSNTVENDQ